MAADSQPEVSSEGHDPRQDMNDLGACQPTVAPRHAEFAPNEGARQTALRSIAGQYSEFYGEGYLKEVRAGWEA